MLALQDRSADVVYSITAPENMDVVITTCGSSYDTKLQVSSNLTDSSSWLCNDDDRDCNSNTANSRVDASLEVSGRHDAVEAPVEKAQPQSNSSMLHD